MTRMTNTQERGITSMIVMDDGLPDALETMNGTDPNNSDSDGDGYLDAIAAI